MGDMMDFPKTIDEFLEDYSFKDKKEFYTNGSMLIPTFRAKQAFEYYMQKSNDLINRQKAEIKELNRVIKGREQLVNTLNKCCRQAKSEAIKEFVERLKIKVKMYNSEDVDESNLIDDLLTVDETVEIIDKLVKEMTEGQE